MAIGRPERDYLTKIIAGLTHREPLARVRMACLLGTIAEQGSNLERLQREAAPALIDVIRREKDDPERLAQAVWALGKIGGEHAIDGMALCLHPNRPVKARVEAAQVLAACGPSDDARQLLAQALDDLSPLARSLAAQTWRQWAESAK